MYPLYPPIVPVALTLACTCTFYLYRQHFRVKGCRSLVDKDLEVLVDAGGERESLERATSRLMAHHKRS